MPAQQSRNGTTPHLIEVVQELSLARDLNTIMKIVRKKARELTDADGATFVLRDDDMCYYADEDAVSPLWKGSRFPMDVCISGWAMINREPAIIEDIYVDDRIPIDAYKPTFVKSLVMVPIRTMDPIGAIGNYWAEQHMPTQREVDLLQSLADITAVAMENVNVYNELDKRVQERTAQLEAFSSSVSHDLQNPLAGMEMNLQMLCEQYEGSMDEDLRNMTNNLKHSVEEMKAMISGLLDFSRLGEQGVNKERVNMQEMVAGIVEELKAQCPDRVVEIRVSDELSLEHVDPILFKRVWTNLIGNALEYTKNEPKAIIDIGMEEQQGERIYFIRDNGAGFPSKKATELFKAFRRAHRSGEFEGTGIGLSLVQQIILKHGGNIWAEGESVVGATFSFSLPWKGSGA